MYFAIILSIVKYLYRLENTSHALLKLKEAYCLSKALHNKGIQIQWATSVTHHLFRAHIF